jgi:hypothetical protein
MFWDRSPAIKNAVPQPNVQPPVIDAMAQANEIIAPQVSYKKL